MLQHNNYVHEGRLKLCVASVSVALSARSKERKRTKTATETVAMQASFKGDISRGF